MTDQTHGEQRLGLLTSSRASTILRGGERGWAGLRDELWSAQAADFDEKSTTGARAYGHEHEEEGAALFWDKHPEVSLAPGGFHTYTGYGPLRGWIASSPDREVIGYPRPRGLEIKSPTTAESFHNNHTLRDHIDQCQHGLLVTGWEAWYLVVHHGELYREITLLPDRQWQAEYLGKALHFWNYAYAGKPVKRRRLSAADL